MVPRHRARVRSPSPVLARIPPFFFRYSPGPFSGTRPHPSSILARTLLRYLPGPFFGTCSNPSPVLVRSFFSTCLNPSPVLARNLLRYSLEDFSVLARTLLWYLPGTFSGTRLDPSPVLARILPIFGTRPDSRYLPEPFSGTCPEPSPVLARTLFRYSPEFYPFSVLARILPVFGTRPDSTIFRYLPEPFSGTCPDQIPNLSRHRDRVSFYLSPASCLDPIVHSVCMTYFP